MLAFGIVLLAILYWKRAAVAPMSLWLGVAVLGAGCAMLALQDFPRVLKGISAHHDGKGSGAGQSS